MQKMQNPNVGQHYRTLVILWLALQVSQIMLLAVLFFANHAIFNFDYSKPLLGEQPLLVIIFAVLGLSTFLLSFVLRRKLINRAISEQKPELVQTALVVGCALCEATTLFGLVVAFAADYQYFFLWFALGIWGIILHFPRRDNLIAASYRTNKNPL